MMEELNHPNIIRVSRSEAINIKKIVQFSKGPTYVMMDTKNIKSKNKIKKVIYISDTYKDDIKKAMGI